MTTRIYVTRHGFSAHNQREDVYMGRWPESRLTDQGRREAKLLGERLSGAGIQHIIHSSLPRTAETAEIIAAHTGTIDLQPEDAFWELSKGDWEGVMTKPMPPDVRQQEAADPFGFRYGNGGESYREVVARIAPAFDRWVENFSGERILFVLHGDVIRAVFFHLIHFPEAKISDFQTDPCSISEFTHQDGRYKTIRLNDVAHLEG